MKVQDLIKLLKKEDPETEVMVVSSRDQGISYDFVVCSRAAGVMEIPEGWVMLLPQIGMPRSIV